MKVKERISLGKTLLFLLFVLSSILGLTHCGGGDSVLNIDLPDNDNNTTTYTVGGTVGGLTGSGLVLQNDNGDDLTISGNDTFTFPTEVANGSAYDVIVDTQPTDPIQVCTVANGTGTVAGADVTNVAVTCVGASGECTSGSIEYDHDISNDFVTYTQQIEVMGSVPFTCDGNNEISGNGTVTISITGQMTDDCDSCNWSATADLDVILSGGFLGAGGVDFDETWYVGSPMGSGSCTDTCDGGNTPFEWPYPEIFTEHSIDFQAINGYKKEGPITAPGASGVYRWTLFFN